MGYINGIITILLFISINPNECLKYNIGMSLNHPVLLCEIGKTSNNDDDYTGISFDMFK